MKMIEPRPYAIPEIAARRLVEHARAFEPVFDGPNLHREDQRTVPVRRQGNAGGI
ncbi:hypothetical protein [Bradyrhizobium genosp. L]|uniref:hypothetical protein n=1 Tax=Bradyrhizobium genosp. L TaxID=83637 RepID=UPI0032DEE055